MSKKLVLVIDTTESRMFLTEKEDESNIIKELFTTNEKNNDTIRVNVPIKEEQKCIKNDFGRKSNYRSKWKKRKK